MNVADDGGAALGKGGFALGVAGEEAVEFFAGVDAIDADVDEGCAGLDHLRGDEAGAADGGDEDVGLAGDLAEVLRFGVADGDGGILVQEQERRRACRRCRCGRRRRRAGRRWECCALENFDDAGGRAGRESRAAGLQAAGVDRGESRRRLWRVRWRRAGPWRRPGWAAAAG